MSQSNRGANSSRTAVCLIPTVERREDIPKRCGNCVGWLVLDRGADGEPVELRCFLCGTTACYLADRLLRPSPPERPPPPGPELRGRPPGIHTPWKLDHAQTPLACRILVLLESGASLSENELAQETGYFGTPYVWRVRKAIRALEERGEIEAARDGETVRWRLREEA